MKKNIIGIIAAAVIIGGCTSIKVQSLPADLNVVHICIENNPAVKVSNFESVISDAIQKHKITTEFYAGVRPKHCQNYLTYTALRSWDLAPYLSHAELRLYGPNKLLASAEFHLKGKGGFSLTKWSSVKSKMEPVVDQLLQEYR